MSSPLISTGNLTLAALKHLVTVMNQFNLTPAESLRPPHTRLAKRLSHSRQEMGHFVHALSHDMNANFMILESSFGSLLHAIEASENEELLEMATHVKICLKESKQFLDDLILLARTGKVDMEPQKVPLYEVVQEVLLEQRDLIESRRAEIKVNRPMPTVDCNVKRVKQILTNLVRNALKHGGDPVSPKIVLSAESQKADLEERSDSDENSQPFVTIRVHDNGPGIERRFWEQVFLPGIRLPGASPEGSGMGLAIVKKIADHYQGSVRIESYGDQGMAIRVSLPGVARKISRSKISEQKHAREIGHDGPHPTTTKRPHQNFESAGV